MRRIYTILGSLAVALILAVGLAPAAHAGEGWIYMKFPTWLGNCPYGGTVNRITAANDRITWSTALEGWDDTTYAKVVFGYPQKIVVQNFCDRPWYKGGPYKSVPFERWIIPHRPGETVYLGPAGQAWG